VATNEHSLNKKTGGHHRGHLGEIKNWRHICRHRSRIKPSNSTSTMFFYFSYKIFANWSWITGFVRYSIDLFFAICYI